LEKRYDKDIVIPQIPLNPPRLRVVPTFSKGEIFLLPLVSDPERSLSELEGSASRKLTRRAKGGGEGFKRVVSNS